jgi:membrane protease YdiL (CAAX protease family)
MIFGFIKLLGKNAILPVATLYAVIHFGKPLPETISSFFGAYFLGIVAYSQKNIGIGILLHCVLAFAMEMFTLI